MNKNEHKKMELLSNSGIVSIECVKHVALINDYEINLMPSSRQLIQIYSFQYIDSIKKKRPANRRSIIVFQTHKWWS